MDVELLRAPMNSNVTVDYAHILVSLVNFLTDDPELQVRQAIIFPSRGAAGYLVEHLDVLRVSRAVGDSLRVVGAVHELPAKASVPLLWAPDGDPCLACILVMLLAEGIAISIEQSIQSQSMVKLIVFATPPEIVVAKAINLLPMAQVHRNDSTSAGHVRRLPVVAVDFRTQLRWVITIGVVHTFFREIVDVLNDGTIEVELHLWRDVLGGARHG
mmetsp:Transcript_14800/g.32634  ORF Transcript_14800/g.32634 Transcript_14800/m.32634 type:complete len:215 (-) Transcript_14800:130-774(-)